MTVIPSPQPLAEETDVDKEPEIVEAPPTRTDVHELAVLLMKAYVGMPLFP